MKHIFLFLAFLLFEISYAQCSGLVRDLTPNKKDSEIDFIYGGINHIILANRTANGDELFFSDGTTAGTQQIINLSFDDLEHRCNAAGILDGKLYFIGRNHDVVAVDNVIYITDGSVAGTDKILGGLNKPNPAHIAVYNGEIYFQASTTKRISKIKDNKYVNVYDNLYLTSLFGNTFSCGHDLTVFNNRLFYLGNSNKIDGELFEGGTGTQDIKIRIVVPIILAKIMSNLVSLRNNCFLLRRPMCLVDNCMCTTHLS